jgi:hypothetical protein
MTKRSCRNNQLPVLTCTDIKQKWAKTLSRRVLTLIPLYAMCCVKNPVRYQPELFDETDQNTYCRDLLQCNVKDHFRNIIIVC